MLDLVNEFLQESEPSTPFYLVGPAGSGKTYSVKKIVKLCSELNLKFVVCAHTHTACDVLRKELGDGIHVQTLHSMLKKRPTINVNAVEVRHIERSQQCGTPDMYDLIIVDEYYMVGGKDEEHLLEACDDIETGDTVTKLMYVGDPNQLPAINDTQTIKPHGKYQVHLKGSQRVAEGNALLLVSDILVSYIEGREKPKPLLSNKDFTRGVDLHTKYAELEDRNILVFTNKRVQSLNSELQERDYPELGDRVRSPTTRTNYILKELEVEKQMFGIYSIRKAFGDGCVALGSKFRTLEHLLTMPDIHYMELSEEDSTSDDTDTYAVMFGHYDYKVMKESLQSRAATTNYQCATQSEMSARMWAQVNKDHPLAKARAKAWRDYLTFNECVICLDFTHAMTVHKSQGSTFTNVLIDTDDLYVCANTNFNLYLRLLYVSISRATDKVYTN